MEMVMMTTSSLSRIKNCCCDLPHTIGCSSLGFWEAFSTNAKPLRRHNLKRRRARRVLGRDGDEGREQASPDRQPRQEAAVLLLEEEP